MTEAIKKKLKGKSWVTTALGICGALGMILGGIHAQFDGDPLTVANWAILLPTAAGLVGIGVKSRDHNVSSEAAGVE